jgi:hypothetical protein
MSIVYNDPYITKIFDGWQISIVNTYNPHCIYLEFASGTIEISCSIPISSKFVNLLKSSGTHNGVDVIINSDCTIIVYNGINIKIHNDDIDDLHDWLIKYY